MSGREQGKKVVNMKPTEGPLRGSGTTHCSSSGSRDHTVCTDSVLAFHIDSRPSRSKHSLIDDQRACGVRRALRSAQPLRACLLRDRVHCPSTNMRNPRTSSSTDPLDLKHGAA
jgi:hypothetical protein